MSRREWNKGWSDAYDESAARVVRRDTSPGEEEEIKILCRAARAILIYPHQIYKALHGPDDPHELMYVAETVVAVERLIED